jgi:hypothetical protein
MHRLARFALKAIMAMGGVQEYRLSRSRKTAPLVEDVQVELAWSLAGTGRSGRVHGRAPEKMQSSVEMRCACAWHRGHAQTR